MSTALVFKSTINGAVTYTLPNHTAQKPRLLIQTGSEAVGKKRTSSDSIRLVMTAVDAEGTVLPEKDSLEIVIKRAAYGTGANLDASFKTMMLDIFGSDEFWNNVIAASLPIKSL